MKRGLEEAKEYMSKIKSAVGDKLVNLNSVYYGREGHLRLARECGYALNDFNEDGQKEILHSSYSSIYVIRCNLKPLLNAKEWIYEMSKQLKESAI
jgi:hypothetical protein